MKIEAALTGRIAWSLAAVLSAAAFIATYRATPVSHAAPAPIWGIARQLRAREQDTLIYAANAVIRSDPFRVDHRPADAAYKASNEDNLHNPTPKAPPPVLSVSGIVGGPPWAALLDGVPGHDASALVYTGDVLGLLRIRSVTRTGVTVTGMDTSWNLTIKHPWQ